MKLIEIVKNVQLDNNKNQDVYAKKLFDIYKDYFLKQFTIHSPYIKNKETIEFVVRLSNELIRIFMTKFKNFKLKSRYSPEELDYHLWAYFQSIADSILDRSLIILYVSDKSEKLQQNAGKIIKNRYWDRVNNQILNFLQNTEITDNNPTNGFEQDEFWVNESQRLTRQFFNTKFNKITLHFEKHQNTIFRNYLDSAVKNFFYDYIRVKNVQKKRRLILYSDDLPDEIFNVLKNLKGYGNLFYYKKKYDCLTIRDSGKALSVIKGLQFPGLTPHHIKTLFKKSNRRAEYQRIIDNITAYITKKCPDLTCRYRLKPKYIKVLLFINDDVMKELLKYTQKDIEIAHKNLEKCITCLDIERTDFIK